MRTLCVVLASLLCSCVDDPADETALAAEEGSARPWQATVSCGDGGVVVDVDRDERRSLQAVIRDPHAVAWLSSHPGDGGAGLANTKGEIILHGTVTRGVFTPDDFTGFDMRGYTVSDALLPQAHVRRENGGLRVQLVSWASGHEVETANWWFAGCH